MPDIFISYSTQDERLASFLYRHLKDEKLNVFMAKISLSLGEKWSQEILDNLKASAWVFFLASKAACGSPYVQQELGAAVITGKKIIPLVWDIHPSELPGWTNQIEALNLRAPFDEIKIELSKIAEKIRVDKVKGWAIIGFLFAGLWFFGKQ